MFVRLHVLLLLSLCYIAIESRNAAKLLVYRALEAGRDIYIHNEIIVKTRFSLESSSVLITAIHSRVRAVRFKQINGMYDGVCFDV